MRPTKRFLRVYIIAWILFGLLNLPGLAKSAKAQKAISQIQITQVDYATFPDVQVRAIIRDGNNQPVPVTDLDPAQGNVELLENGNVVSYQFDQVTAGVEALLVLDDHTDMAQVSQMLQGYVSTMGAEDAAGIYLLSATGNSFLQPITKDREALNQAIQKIKTRKPGGRLENTDGLLEALNELSNSLYRGEGVQSLVFVTSGDLRLQGTEPDNVTKRANELKISVHVITMGGGTFTAREFQRVANGTRGLYVIYKNEGSLSKLLTWFGEQRTQYHFKSRSLLGVSSERTLEVRTKIGGVSATATYRVELSPPNVVIMDPQTNLEITRQADTREEAETAMDGVEPTQQDVIAVVSWPDGYPRKITEARFLLDGKETGSLVSFPGEQITFRWDLRPYRQEGTNAAQLRVQVKDELNLENISEPVNAKVTVIIPEPPPPVLQVVTPEDLCADETGLEGIRCRVRAYIKTTLMTPTGWISIGSLLVAAVAVFIAIRFRGQLAQAGGEAVNNIRKTITRLTTPLQTDVGGYIEVIRGDESLKGRSIPLMKNTVTKAGRNPEKVELVFDMGNDRSVVSRLHCDFREEGGLYKVRDLSSTHGTFVNGDRIPQGSDGYILSDGDKIELGPAEKGGVVLVFKTLPGTGGAGGGFKTTPLRPEDLYKTNLIQPKDIYKTNLVNPYEDDSKKPQ